MAMPQRDDPPRHPPSPRLRRTSGYGGQVRSSFALASYGGQVEEIKRLEPPSRVRYGGPGALFEYAVMHGDETEAERIREELRKLADEV